MTVPDVITHLIVQWVWLLTLAIPIACISWTVTHEELFKPIHDFCTVKSKNASSAVLRKIFYMLTCEYCFSHYVTITMLVITDYKLLFDDWRGYLVAGFSLVWIANLYMSLYSYLRTDIKREKVKTTIEEQEISKSEEAQNMRKLNH